MKVLIVDDSPVMRELIKEALATMGDCQMAEAENGKAALDLLQGGGVDLVLLDWNMPEVNGLDTLKAMRGRGDKTPVMMVTSENEKPRVVQAITSGANDYMIKPFDPEQLTTKVQALMKRMAAATA